MITGSPDLRAAGASAGWSGRAPYPPPDILLTGGQKRGGRRGEEAAAHGGQGLADQRTAECGALGGSREECPSRQENGGGGSRESRPWEGRYKANLPFVLLGRVAVRPKKGGRVRLY